MALAEKKAVTVTTNQVKRPDEQPPQPARPNVLDELAQRELARTGEKTSARFRWPVLGPTISQFGPKQNGLFNDGINISALEGTPIKAAEDGVVAYVGNELEGYGNLLLLTHENGFVTAYAHASQLLVKRGDRVKRGQIIGRVGKTGRVEIPQLHFEIRVGSKPVPPLVLLGPQH